MNEWLELGSPKGTANVWVWVLAAGNRSGGKRHLLPKSATALPATGRCAAHRLELLSRVSFAPLLHRFQDGRQRLAPLS